MSQPGFFYTIDKPAVAEFKDKGSKFIAYAYPLSNTTEFKIHLANVKKEHPKAVHYCFAYRLGPDGNNFRVGDDGEPAGTAGKPILAQVNSKQLTNVLIIVVRYFGGTLLGVPGLINAYKTVASHALQSAPIVQRTIEIKYNLHFDYTMLNDVMLLIKQNNCTIIKQEIQLFCHVVIGIPATRLQHVLHRTKDLRSVEITKATA
jgi:uncharacterized YigZ family protein